MGVKTLGEGGGPLGRSCGCRLDSLMKWTRYRVSSGTGFTDSDTFLS